MRGLLIIVALSLAARPSTPAASAAYAQGERENPAARSAAYVQGERENPAARSAAYAQGERENPAARSAAYAQGERGDFTVRPERSGGEAGAESKGGSVMPALRQVVSALEDEDIAQAETLIAPIVKARGQDRAVMTVTGLVRYHQQRYGEAAELLEKGGFPTGGLDYLALSRAARDITKEHARAEGEHFIVSYPKGKDEVLVPYVLDALEAQRKALQDDLGWAAPGKVVIEILNDTRELARLSTLTDEEIKTSGTIALCKFNKLMIVSPKALVKGYDWLDTAAHEYTHYVVTARTRNSTPIWLHEGLAKYSETRWRGPGGELSAASAGLLREALRKGELVTFAQMHPSMAKLPSQEAAALAFAEVALAVEYLEDKGGRPLMNRILDLVQQGTTAEQAVARALGVTFDAFLADWKRYMAARPLPEGGAHTAEKLRFKGDPKHGGAHSEWAEIPDERARGFARMGEIFRERGRWGAARIEYGKAVARVGKGIAVLSDKYALASMMSGHDDEARSALVEALRRHPQYAALHLHLARLHLKQKAWLEAKGALLQANATDPFDPEIHAGLAAVHEALGDAGAASRERRFAQMLAH